MNIFFVFRDGQFLDEPLATRTGAEAYVRIMKSLDKKKKEKHIYEIESGSALIS